MKLEWEWVWKYVVVWIKFRGISKVNIFVVNGGFDRIFNKNCIRIL